MNRDDIQKLALQGLFAVLLAWAGFAVQESAAATKELRSAVSDLRAAVSEMRAEGRATAASVATLQARLERIEDRGPR